jgi:hypothetical protein
MHKRLIILLLLVVNVCFGMQDSENTADDLSMTKINSWKDMEQFAGKIIAYKAVSRYIHRNGYKIDGLKFGQVSANSAKWPTTHEGGENRAYKLSRIIKKEKVASICALLDYYICNGLWVRRAKEEEIEKIEKALKDNKAKWCG